MTAAWLAWHEEAAPMLRQLEKRERDPVPKEQEVLEREPELTPATALIARAYNVTSTSRSIGMGGVGPIPQFAIDAFCDREGLDLDAAELLSSAVRYLDDQAMIRIADERRQNTPAAPRGRTR